MFTAVDLAKKIQASMKTSTSIRCPVLVEDTIFLRTLAYAAMLGSKGNPYNS